MKLEIRLFKTIGYSFLFLFVAIILLILFSKSGLTSDQKHNNMIFSIISLIISVASLLRVRYLKNNLNNLPFEERCKRMAEDIKKGKRKWFLNPIGNSMTYLAVPLSPRNMNEMGGGKHVSTDKEKILQLLTEGRIGNEEVAKTTLKYC